MTWAAGANPERLRGPLTLLARPHIQLITYANHFCVVVVVVRLRSVVPFPKIKMEGDGEGADEPTTQDMLNLLASQGIDFEEAVNAVLSVCVYRGRT